jgi:hypothetical protein
MVGRGRDGRVLSGRVSVEIGRHKRVCPVCGAGIGWRCTKVLGDQILPRKTDHRERNKRDQVEDQG